VVKWSVIGHSQYLCILGYPNPERGWGASEGIPNIAAMVTATVYIVWPVIHNTSMHVSYDISEYGFIRWQTQTLLCSTMSKWFTYTFIVYLQEDKTIRKVWIVKIGRAPGWCGSFSRDVHVLFPPVSYAAYLPYVGASGIITSIARWNYSELRLNIVMCCKHGTSNMFDYTTNTSFWLQIQ